MYGSNQRDENVFELIAERVYGLENQKIWTDWLQTIDKIQIISR